LVRRFQAIAEPIDRQIATLTRARENLARTRDLLLPRLISGKLAVEHADIQIPPRIAAEADMLPESCASELSHA
jgi:type I restriction enzyme S subunit